MPIHRRLPKRGFTNVFKVEYTEVNLDQLAKIARDEIGLKELASARLIKNEEERVKILGRGEVSASKKIQAHRFSQAARQKIEKAGGQALVLGNK
jgi:large subunit ribosomal protein L15